MPLFEYKAVAPSGETVRGTMEAVSEDLVIAKLQEGGNIPISAHAAGQGGFGAVFGSKHLKAISVIVTGSVHIHNPKALMQSRIQQKENYAFDLSNLKRNNFNLNKKLKQKKLLFNRKFQFKLNQSINRLNNPQSNQKCNQKNQPNLIMIYLVIPLRLLERFYPC